MVASTRPRRRSRWACAWIRPARAAIAIVVAAAGCHRTPPSDAHPRELVVSLAADADMLMPPFTATSQGAAISDQIFERLADPDSTLNTIGDRDYRPRLADRWRWAPDSLSIAFHIDARARWQDGVPVTARDVRFSFRVFKDSAAGSIAAPLLSNIDSVSVRDSTTAVVWFHTRTPDEFYAATYSPRILPAHLLDTIAPERWRTSAFGRAPVGSGPYRFVRWAPGTSIELDADTAYRAGRPSFVSLSAQGRTLMSSGLSPISIVSAGALASAMRIAPSAASIPPAPRTDGRMFIIGEPSMRAT